MLARCVQCFCREWVFRGLDWARWHVTVEGEFYTTIEHACSHQILSAGALCIGIMKERGKNRAKKRGGWVEVHRLYLLSHYRERMWEEVS